MPITKSKTYKCDVCGKERTFKDTAYFGGHPTSGWFHVNRLNGSTQLEQLRRQHDWVCCSQTCVGKLAATLES